MDEPSGNAPPPKPAETETPPSELPTPSIAAAPVETPAPPPAVPPPTAPPAEAPAKPPVDPRRARYLRIAAIAAPVVVLLVVLLSHRLFIAAYIRYRAAGYGVHISFDGFETGTDRLTLKGAHASLYGVDGLTVTAGRVKLGMRGARVTSVEATDVTVAVEGSATDRVLELAAWAGENPATFRLTGSASPIRVEWRADDEGSPWLSATGGTLTSDGKAARFSAATSNVGGVPLGKAAGSFTVDGSVVTVELGKTPGAEAPITARIAATPKPPRVDVTLRAVKLETLGAALGLALPAPGAIAQGRAELTLGRRGSTEAITGSAELKLDGYTPPHPREMAGVLAGKKTAVTTRLSVAPDRSKVTLSDVVARAGRLELKGPVACSELTRSVAKERLGLLGEIVGDTASGAVGGSVAVTVTVEADSRDLRNAKVKHKAAVGCGLKLPF